MGLRGGDRTMYIGAPLVLALPAGELFAVLGHELGHYSGRHTSFARVSVRGALALETIIHRMDYAVVRGIFIAYAKRYFAVTAGIRREHERQADRVAIAVSGRQQTMSVLSRLTELCAAEENRFIGTHDIVAAQVAGKRLSNAIDLRLVQG